MKILVVDDHPLMTEALGIVLRTLDPSASLVGAADLATALRLSDGESSFDLALLDLGLPDCSGLDGLARLREARPGLPVVVLSGVNDAKTILAALDLGAMGFIPKTSSRDVLLGAVRLVAAGQVYIPVEALKAASVPALPDATPAPPRAPEKATVPDRGTVRPADLGLTPRQADVLALMLKGHSNKLIARKLDISESTVKVHVSAVLQSLNVTTRTQALIAAMDMGLRLEG
jgi:DNA-binding NarL/FixJ family response regulator